MKKLICFLAISCTCFGAMSMAVPARAIGPLLSDSLIQEVSCQNASGDAKEGKNCNYSLNSFVKLGISLSNIILGIVGSLTLLMFIYGGVILLTSAGNTERVSKGKEIILGAVVGLLIVFGSYTLIDFIVNRVFEAKINGQNAFTGSAPKDTSGPKEALPTDCSKHTPVGACVASGECKGSVIATKECDGIKGATKQVCCLPPSCEDAGYSCNFNLGCPNNYSPQPNVCANHNPCCKSELNNQSD